MKNYLTLEYPLYEQLCEICELASRPRPVYIFPYLESPAVKADINQLEQLGLVTKHRVNKNHIEITKAIPSKLALELFNARQIFPIFTEPAGWLFTIKQYQLHPTGQVTCFSAGVNACTYEDALQILNERKLHEANDLPKHWVKYHLVNLKAAHLPFPVDFLTY